MEELPVVSTGERAFQNDGDAQWMRAWHVCKLKAVYSIMSEGRLRPSRCAASGEILRGNPRDLFAL